MNTSGSRRRVNTGINLQIGFAAGGQRSSQADIYNATHVADLKDDYSTAL